MKNSIKSACCVALAAVGIISGVHHTQAGEKAGAVANGSGWQVSEDGQKRTFAFTAVQLPDGSVTGQAQVKSRAGDTMLHVAIDCLVSDGNTTYISGPIVSSNNEGGAPIGFTVFFAVQDNGQGHPSPDLITPGFVFPPIFPEPFPPLPTNCETLLELLGPPHDHDYAPIDGGNITVH